jgi:hypothetical protein
MHLRALIKSSEMTQFQPSEIQKFLEAIDSYLKSSFDFIIIGGVAAALAYKASKTTTDIDTANRILEELRYAFEAAAKKTGLAIPVSLVGVFDPPYYYEDRLQRYNQTNLRFLKVYVPEQHDLALMKIVRGYGGVNTFCFETLVERFLTEMTQVIGNSNTIRMNFLLAISELFGNELAEHAEKLTKNWQS